jgi:hypothetical protein
MRQLADSSQIRRLLHELAESARRDGRVYLTGGATAVLLGWRASTIDVDLKFVPDQDEVLRAIPAIKDRLQINVELASPDDFIPVAEGWEARSAFIEQIRRLAVYHFDLYAQALAKLERGHQKDLGDVRAMVSRGLVDPSRALEYFQRIEPDLYRYPAIHGPAFRRSVETFFGGG